MSEEDRVDKLETLRRYETLRREQLGAAVNLILGLAAAAVGFCLSRLIDKDSHFSTPGTYYFLSATAVFIVTVGLCMITTWTRLQGFKLTAKKLQGELRGASAAQLKQLTAAADRFGVVTWFLFRAQSISFFIGVFLLASSIWIFYKGRLFPNVKTPHSDVQGPPTHLKWIQ